MDQPVQLALPLVEAPPSDVASAPTIYTMGYAGWAPADLRDEVVRLGAALIDVRIAPTSKSPQWRKDALAALLGPIYTHLPALGNRNAFSGGPAELADPEGAVGPVAALLARGPVVLLCGCGNPDRCHRGLAASFLAERLGGEVVHIPSPTRQKRTDGEQLGLPGL
jgi:uncharacterized protein (DUF488 family)